MNTAAESLPQARQTTLLALRQIDEEQLAQLTELTLPEIKDIQREIADILPAGNLPAFVLNGLLKLKGRRINADRARQDISALLRGLDLLPQSLYGMFIAGPATVLYAYQKLLQLAGKDIENAFPQGTWQFYLEFGLREDTARHTNATAGFHRALAQSDTPRGEVAKATAWLVAALELLYDYEELLAQDWRERILLRELYRAATEVGSAHQPPFRRLVRDWVRERPYHAAPEHNYLAYRRLIFERFSQKRFAALPEGWRDEVQERYQAIVAEELSAYQEQMSLLFSLEPDSYLERKHPIPLWRATVGFIHQGHTYLLPACRRNAQGSPLCYPPDGAQPHPLYALSPTTLCDAQRRTLTVDRSGWVSYEGTGQRLGRLRPPTSASVGTWVATILAHAPVTPEPELDLLLAALPRREQTRLRRELSHETRRELSALGYTPLIINWDEHPTQPLSTLRRTHRGIGDHALTVLRTSRTFAFDQSHIFFDGIWGMAVAEILTGSAIQHLAALTNTPAEEAPYAPTPAPLNFTAPPAMLSALRAKITPGEMAAEAQLDYLGPLVLLRRWLHDRGVSMTINDLLVMYHFFHVMEYDVTPAAPVQEALAALRARLGPEAADELWQEVVTALEAYRQTPPVLLIPMDASNVAPHERIYPTTFDNPLPELPALYNQALAYYERYRLEPSPTTWQPFDEERRLLLANLKAFGDVLLALKAVTMRGESFNTATLQLLAHLPPSLQHLLDEIPQRIGVLNEIIKGNEVFSNVGRVAPGSTLCNFSSAKDDGATKALVWGFLTDDTGTLHVNLRDFRSFVPRLLEAGADDLAQALAEDYVQSYVAGLNRFAKDLSKVLAAKGARDNL